MSETQPEPREVRREFDTRGGWHVVVRLTAEGDYLAVIESIDGAERDCVLVPVADAPGLARLILEVHAEATRPEPPECPWCGSGHRMTVVPYKNHFFVQCRNDDCGASGPNRRTEAEALAAFAGLRKGEL